MESRPGGFAGDDVPELNEARLDRDLLGRMRASRRILLHEYEQHTRLWFEIGNEAFAQRIPELSREASDPEPEPAASYVIHHSWLPGQIDVSPPIASAVARGDLPPEASTDPEWREFVEQIESHGWLRRSSIDVEALTAKARETFYAIQNHVELREFLQLVAALCPQIVVEIGTARGGMFYAFAQVAADDATLISIDLPGAPNCGGQTPRERELFRTFLKPGQSAHFLAADSHDVATLSELKALLGGRRIDILFIDGDHSYDGVSSDFDMYAPFVRPGGLVALHDINLTSAEWDVGTGDFWRELSGRYEGRAIVDAAGTCSVDEANDKEYAWGIGVVTMPATPGPMIADSTVWQAAAAEFERQGVVVIPNACGPFEVERLRRELRCAPAESGVRSLDDVSTSYYALPAFEHMLLRLQGRIETLAGCALWPTYSWVWQYGQGAELAAHGDREACEITVSLRLSGSNEEPWPLHIERRDGTILDILLQDGDIAVFRGTELTHWREPLTGASHAQALFHYVERAGRYAGFKFDKRDAIGAHAPKQDV